VVWWPCISLLGSVLKTVERDAGPLFTMLRNRYATALSRDASFAAVCPDGAAIALDLRAAASLIMLCPPVSWLCSQYLDRIGELYFGLQAPKGMLEELLSAFK